MKNYNCVLLVDDDPISNFINHEVLRKNRVCKEISISRNGEEALAFLNEYQSKNQCLPQVILVDIKMPIMDGFEFLQEFEKLSIPGKEKIRVIMLSDDYSLRDVEALNKMGHSHYLNKPLDKDKLLNLLKVKKGTAAGTH
jgi:CheY-like chemotaxis protein